MWSLLLHDHCYYVLTWEVLWEVTEKHNILFTVARVMVAVSALKSLMERTTIKNHTCWNQTKCKASAFVKILASDGNRCSIQKATSKPWRKIWDKDLGCNEACSILWEMNAPIYFPYDTAAYPRHRDILRSGSAPVTLTETSGCLHCPTLLSPQPVPFPEPTWSWLGLRISPAQVLCYMEAVKWLSVLGLALANSTASSAWHHA